MAVPCDAASVAMARRWVVDQVNGMYGRSGEALGDLQTIVSELVTNALRADATSLTLCLDGHHSYVSIAATDDAPGLPRRLNVEPDADHGRGLLIVEALATQWGVGADRRGKTVWADVAMAPDSGPTFACEN